MYNTPEFRKFFNGYQRSLLPHQGKMTDRMIDDTKLTICMPTGTGKSRIIYADMLEHLRDPRFDTFVLSSHRLLLNIQHLNELFETLRPVLSAVGFIFVGSYQIDLDEFVINKESNNLLAKLQLNYKDLISSETDPRRIEYLVNEHKSRGRDVIIITTYHSLDKLENIDIHTLYCDEAHFLASEHEMSLFKNNFEKVNARRTFFFTATPKDLIEETDKFLMNNETIFGKRDGISFKHALDESLIVKPYIHLIEPKNLKETKKYLSPINYAKIILDGFEKHKTAIETYSKDASICKPKILVKCPSVEEMWKIQEELLKETNVKVFCGASWSPRTHNYFISETGINSKISFLKSLQNLPDSDEAIILHYDILSEGIDVPGITGVMFLSNTLPTKSKILQTIGRSTRLHREDRKKMQEGRLAKCDYKNYIKPYCAVLLPVLDREMQFSVEEIARMIINLRDVYDFVPSVQVMLGEDNSRGKKNNEFEGLNDIETAKSVFSKIDEINHKIEILDDEYREELQESEVKRIFDLKAKNRIEYIEKYCKELGNER